MYTVDPKIKSLVQAIGSAETGLKSTPQTYQQKGASGEFGRYQFMPETYKTYAQKYLGDSNAAPTVENQNRIAYSFVKEKKDAGYNPAQIASMWNSGEGEPDAYKGTFKTGTPSKGTNSLGVQYDVPGYAMRVSNYYRQFSGSQQQAPTDLQTAQNQVQTGVTQEHGDNKPGYFSRVGSDITGLPGELRDTAKAGADEIQQGIEASRNGEDLKAIGKVALGIGRSGIGSAWDVLKTIFSPISEAVAPVIQHTVDTISDIPSVQESAMHGANAKILALKDKADAIAAKHPEVAQLFSDTYNLATTLAAETKGAPAAKSAVSDLGNVISDATKDAIKPIRTALEDKYVNTAKSDWERFGGDYTKTSKLLDQQEAMAKTGKVPDSFQDTPTFLAEQGISPQNIMENGKFSSTKAAEIADNLTGSGVKPFEKMLNEQLDVVQQGQPPVPIDSIRKAVADQINSLTHLVPEKIESMIRDANKSINAISRKYPEGITLKELNELKGKYWRDTKFDINKPLQPQINYSIGTAMKNVIENRAGDANIKEMNGLLGNYYKSAKFLNGFGDRTIKLTGKQKIVRGAIKAGATILGEKAFGISGGIGGYFLSKSIANMLENASNPLKEYILNNLEKTNPKAYEEAIKWLGKQERARNARLMLMPGGELGTDKNPIITPNKTGTPTPTPSAVTYGRKASGKTVSRSSTTKK